MAKYLIRTNGRERKTHITGLGNSSERLGLVYTDFLLRPENRDITKEEVIDPLTNKSIGEIRLNWKGNLIVIRSNGKNICTINEKGEYHEEDKRIPFRRYGKKDLMSEKYERLRNMGLDYAYSLGENSTISHAFCFERDGDLASVVFGKNEDVNINDALKGLGLSLFKRVEDQDYVFEFVR